MTDISENFDEVAASDVTADDDASASAAPSISEILSSSRDESATADVPARTAPEEDREERSRIPIAALRRERERRAKIDAQVAEMERELERFNNQRWGFEDDTEQQAPARQGRDTATVDRHIKSFASKHGEERLEAVNAAILRANPAQQQDLQAIVNSSSSDPTESVHSYLQKQGLLDPAFKAPSIRDALAGKQQEPAAEVPSIDQRLAQLAEREQSMTLAERRAHQAASRSDFISDHGRDVYAEMDAVTGHLIESNHPIVPHLAEAARASADPYRTTAEMLSQFGIWSPSQTQPSPRPASVFPSNFASVRNAGSRSGPAWAGPPSLESIFDTTRPNKG